MSAHTPGLWFVEHGSLRVLSDDGRSTIICVVTGSESNPQSIADARLIAAAPEFYVFAQEVSMGAYTLDEVADRAREIIAKATQP